MIAQKPTNRASIRQLLLRNRQTGWLIRTTQGAFDPVQGEIPTSISVVFRISKLASWPVTLREISTYKLGNDTMDLQVDDRWVIFELDKDVQRSDRVTIGYATFDFVQVQQVESIFWYGIIRRSTGGRNVLVATKTSVFNLTQTGSWSI